MVREKTALSTAPSTGKTTATSTVLTVKYTHTGLLLCLCTSALYWVTFMCSHHEKSGPWATTIQTTPSALSTVSRGGFHHLDPTKPRPPLVTSQFYWSNCSLKNRLRGEGMKERVSGCSYCECTRSLWKQAPVVWGSDINNHIASVYFWMILNVWGLKKKKNDGPPCLQGNSWGLQMWLE